MRLTIRLMTASISPGDAIGNYISSLARLLRGWGARVELYADHVDPAYGAPVYPSHSYPRGGDGVLWYHYSIYSDNVAVALASGDYKVIDYHGVSPPHLFSGENERLAALCRRGLETLPAVAANANYLVTHSGYTTAELRALGQENICQYPLFVDTAHFRGEDEELAALLARASYMLFVGRIVPQKAIHTLLEIFAGVQARFPHLMLILAGARDLASRYQSILEQRVKALGLEGRVLFTGQVNNPAVLAALYRHARLTVIASEWESFCVPVAESLYFGTPVAVNNVPPLPEVAGPAGIVFDSTEPATAATTIGNLLEDESRYQTLRERAQQQAKNYSGRALERNVRLLMQLVLRDTMISPDRSNTEAVE
ncbi:MAG: glycosyltransferase [Anaerolineae bacterium]|nr:glycosyltransferase [Anaerolineae bacterium]